jgi:putative NIF3 family GTP cyclohydrolase 1 type 2
MTDDVAGKIVEAYKTSPLLTGLLLLNVAVIFGFGWWEHKRVAAVDAFVTKQMEKQDALQERLLEMAARCGSQ